MENEFFPLWFLTFGYEVNLALGWFFSSLMFSIDSQKKSPQDVVVYWNANRTGAVL